MSSLQRLFHDHDQPTSQIHDQKTVSIDTTGSIDDCPNRIIASASLSTTTTAILERIVGLPPQPRHIELSHDDQITTPHVASAMHKLTSFPLSRENGPVSCDRGEDYHRNRDSDDLEDAILSANFTLLSNLPTTPIRVSTRAQAAATTTKSRLHNDHEHRHQPLTYPPHIDTTRESRHCHPKDARTVRFGATKSIDEEPYHQTSAAPKPTDPAASPGNIHDTNPNSSNTNPPSLNDPTHHNRRQQQHPTTCIKSSLNRNGYFGGPMGDETLSMDSLSDLGHFDNQFHFYDDDDDDISSSVSTRVGETSGSNHPAQILSDDVVHRRQTQILNHQNGLKSDTSSTESIYTDSIAPSTAILAAINDQNHISLPSTILSGVPNTSAPKSPFVKFKPLPPLPSLLQRRQLQRSKDCDDESGIVAENQATPSSQHPPRYLTQDQPQHIASNMEAHTEEYQPKLQSQPEKSPELEDKPEDEALPPQMILQTPDNIDQDTNLLQNPIIAPQSQPFGQLYPEINPNTDSYAQLNPQIMMLLTQNAQLQQQLSLLASQNTQLMMFPTATTQSNDQTIVFNQQQEQQHQQQHQQQQGDGVLVQILTNIDRLSQRLSEVETENTQLKSQLSSHVALVKLNQMESENIELKKQLLQQQHQFIAQSHQPVPTLPVTIEQSKTFENSFEEQSDHGDAKQENGNGTKEEPEPSNTPEKNVGSDPITPESALVTDVLNNAFAFPSPERPKRKPQSNSLPQPQQFQQPTFDFDSSFAQDAGSLPTSSNTNNSSRPTTVGELLSFGSSPSRGHHYHHQGEQMHVADFTMHTLQISTILPKPTVSSFTGTLPLDDTISAIPVFNNQSSRNTPTNDDNNRPNNNQNNNCDDHSDTEPFTTPVLESNFLDISADIEEELQNALMTKVGRSPTRPRPLQISRHAPNTSQLFQNQAHGATMAFQFGLEDHLDDNVNTSSTPSQQRRQKAGTPKPLHDGLVKTSNGLLSSPFFDDDNDDQRRDNVDDGGNVNMVSVHQDSTVDISPFVPPSSSPFPSTSSPQPIAPTATNSAQGGHKHMHRPTSPFISPLLTTSSSTANLAQTQMNPYKQEQLQHHLPQPQSGFQTPLPTRGRPHQNQHLPPTRLSSPFRSRSPLRDPTPASRVLLTQGPLRNGQLENYHTQSQPQPPLSPRFTPLISPSSRSRPFSPVHDGRIETQPFRGTSPIRSPSSAAQSTQFRHASLMGNRNFNSPTSSNQFVSSHPTTPNSPYPTRRSEEAYHNFIKRKEEAVEKKKQQQFNSDIDMRLQQAKENDRLLQGKVQHDNFGPAVFLRDDNQQGNFGVMGFGSPIGKQSQPLREQQLLQTPKTNNGQNFSSLEFSKFNLDQVLDTSQPSHRQHQSHDQQQNLNQNQNLQPLRSVQIQRRINLSPGVTSSVPLIHPSNMKLQQAQPPNRAKEQQLPSKTTPTNNKQHQFHHFHSDQSPPPSTQRGRLIAEATATPVTTAKPLRLQSPPRSTIPNPNSATQPRSPPPQLTSTQTSPSTLNSPHISMKTQTKGGNMTSQRQLPGSNQPKSNPDHRKTNPRTNQQDQEFSVAQQRAQRSIPFDQYVQQRSSESFGGNSQSRGNENNVNSSNRSTSCHPSNTTNYTLSGRKDTGIIMTSNEEGGDAGDNLRNPQPQPTNIQQHPYPSQTQYPTTNTSLKYANDHQSTSHLLALAPPESKTDKILDIDSRYDWIHHLNSTQQLLLNTSQLSRLTNYQTDPLPQPIVTANANKIKANEASSALTHRPTSTNPNAPYSHSPGPQIGKDDDIQNILNLTHNIGTYASTYNNNSNNNNTNSVPNNTSYPGNLNKSFNTTHPPPSHSHYHNHRHHNHNNNDTTIHSAHLTCGENSPEFDHTNNLHHLTPAVPLLHHDSYNSTNHHPHDNNNTYQQKKPYSNPNNQSAPSSNLISPSPQPSHITQQIISNSMHHQNTGTINADTDQICFNPTPLLPPTTSSTQPTPIPAFQQLQPFSSTMMFTPTKAPIHQQQHHQQHFYQHSSQQNQNSRALGPTNHQSEHHGNEQFFTPTKLPTLAPLPSFTPRRFEPIPPFTQLRSASPNSK